MRAARSLATPFLLLPALLLFCCVLPLRAQPAPGRAALVIANAAYPDSDAVLPTPVADAQAFADELKRRGFAVESATNLTKEAMQAAIDRFAKRVESGSTALVFFAGYGIQIARKNYLIPVDAKIWSESDVLRDGIAVDTVMADLDKRGARNRVVVLDASRFNPFERRYRSFSTGLAPARTTPGMLVLYSAAAGSVVREQGANRSLFVTELVKQIGLPDQTAEQAFGATRDAISKATRNQQNPALASSLEETFSFDPNRKPGPAPKPATGGEVAALPETLETRPQAPVAPQPEKPKALPEDVAIVPPAKTPETMPPVAELPPPKVPELPKPPETLRPKPLDEIVPTVTTKEPPAKEAFAKEPVAKETVKEPPAKEPQIAALPDKGPDAPRAAEDEAVHDFETANAIGTVSAFKDFLSRHPSGSLAARAKAEIARLEAAQMPSAQTPPAQTPPVQSPPAQPPSAQTAPAEQAAPYSEAERKRKAVLDQRIAKNPRDALAFYERGQFHAQRGDAAAAVPDFDQSIRLDPTSPEAFNNRCWMRAVLNELQRALDDCNKAIALRRNFVDALDSRGFVNLKLGEYRAAVTDYDSALKADPTHASSLYGRGLARRRLGQSALGARDLAEAVQLNQAIEQEFAQYGLR